MRPPERKSPVAEKRKFAALANLRLQEPEPPEDMSSSVQPDAAPQAAEKGRGRPATGKRSNPEYKLYAHYLKKRTLREVNARLMALHPDSDQQPDMSDLLQQLLEEWLERQRR
jgi:hypothetical protein